MIASEGPWRFIAEGHAGVDAGAFAESVPIGDAADAAEDEGVLHVVRTRTDLRGIHPWDAAHEALDKQDVLEGREEVTYLEPDFVQGFPICEPRPESFQRGQCEISGYNNDWAPSEGDSAYGWHLSDEYSGLRSARDQADGGRGVRIGILDTGYDPDHITLPENFQADASRNYSGDGHETDATDPGRHFPTTQPGHGTATMAILAGKWISKIGDRDFNDVLGGAPHADIVHFRIANSVVQFRTSSMARGIRAAVDAGCQVLSISMGGVPTRAWARAINYAYEHGVVICAAAGNRFGQSPPKYIVYPARFERVIAVCGATAEKRPYFRDGLHMLMHGSFGPKEKMKTAMAAYTPNIPWAEMGCNSVVNPNGAGTSSATPQVAAAAALYMAKHANSLPSPGFERSEVVRQALFQKADLANGADVQWFGNGLLRASHSLQFDPATQVSAARRATVRFPILRMSIGLETVPGDSPDTALKCHDRMCEVEALQVFERSRALHTLSVDWDPTGEEPLDSKGRRKVLEGIASDLSTSKYLRNYLTGKLKRM